jgi:hypothetical protein
MNNFTKYAKALMAVLGAVVGAVTTSAAGASTGQVIATAVSAGVTALLVFLVPNTRQDPPTAGYRVVQGHEDGSR